jgi:multiple sugar transport system permease protein
MTSTSAARRLGVTPQFQRDRHAKGAGHKGTTSTIITMLLLILMAVYFLTPLWWLLVSTTKSTNQLYNSQMFWFTGKSNLFYNIGWLSSYQGGVFWRWVLNSVLYAGIAAALATMISAMAGYLIAKYAFRGKSALSMTVLGALMVPTAAMTIPVFLVVKDLGLLNTPIAVILPMLFNPFGVYFMMVYIREAMPSELLDAGRIDGANDYGIFFRIGMPLIRPGVVTLFLISFVGAWNNFSLPLVMLTNTNLYPVTLGLQIWSANLQSAGAGQPLYPLIVIGAFISIVPMLVLFPIFRKYIVSGIALGSVKS